jgi:prepilin-type N-terminal cleavage/methylation domain-containing protein
MKLLVQAKRKNVYERLLLSLSKQYDAAFTIVELLIVIVVIGILAGITVVAYSGIQARARDAKITNDLDQLTKAIEIARNNGGKVLTIITGSSWTGGNCATKPTGTDLAALARSDGCWTSYLSSLNTITAASGLNVNNMVDPWGRPYYIDENEGSPGCLHDTIAAYDHPFNGASPSNQMYLPNSGYSGCTQ